MQADNAVGGQTVLYGQDCWHITNIWVCSEVSGWRNEDWEENSFLNPPIQREEKLQQIIEHFLERLVDQCREELWRTKSRSEEGLESRLWINWWAGAAPSEQAGGKLADIHRQPDNWQAHGEVQVLWNFLKTKKETKFLEYFIILNFVRDKRDQELWTGHYTNRIILWTIWEKCLSEDRMDVCVQKHYFEFSGEARKEMTQTSSQVPTCPLTLVTEHNINCEVGAGSLQGPRDTATTRLPTLHELGNQSPVSSPGCCSSLSTCTPSKHSLLRRFCLSSLSKLTSDSSQFLEKLLNLIGNLEKIWRT